MPYVDPDTVHNPSTGAVAPASWGDVVRDDLEFLIDPPACSVYHNTTQSTSNNTITILSANSENYDNDAMHSTVSNTSRITAQTAGRYLVGSTINWAVIASTDARLLTFIVDGTTVYNVAQLPSINSASVSTAFGGTRTLTLTAGQYVESRVRQQSGGALNVTLEEFAALFLTR